MKQLNEDLRPVNSQKKLKFNFSERGKKKLQRAELRKKTNKKNKNTHNNNILNLNNTQKNDLIKLNFSGYLNFEK